MRRVSGPDLIGGPIFWAAAGLTLAGLIAALLFRAGRAWIGLGVLVMWTGFSLANAVRSRRVHSIASAHVYLVAAAATAASPLRARTPSRARSGSSASPTCISAIQNTRVLNTEAQRHKEILKIQNDTHFSLLPFRPEVFHLKFSDVGIVLFERAGE